jgi:hypothetical protein
MSEAEKAEKPLVASLSQNSHWGWHDGMSDQARYLGFFCKDANLALMLCSSNEGGYGSYINEKINAGDTLRLVPYGNYSDNYLWGGMKTEKQVMFEIGIVNLSENKEYYRIPITFSNDGIVDEDGEGGNGVWFNFTDDK